MGALLVPATWKAGTPAVRPIAPALPGVGVGVGVGQQALTESLESAFGNMTLANAAGRAVGDTLGARGRAPSTPAPASLISDEEFVEQRNRLLGR